MNHEEVRSRAKSLEEIASTKKKSPDPVPDNTWDELVQLHNWAMQHALRPGLLTPLKDSPHTWPNVEGAAQAVLDSLG
jgi:hypothetical protein